MDSCYIQTLIIGNGSGTNSSVSGNTGFIGVAMNITANNILADCLNLTFGIGGGFVASVNYVVLGNVSVNATLKSYKYQSSDTYAGALIGVS